MATPTSLPSTFVDNTPLPASSLNALRGAFRVLQVVQGLGSTTDADTSVTTFASSGLSATITPSSTSSKILIMTSQELFKSNGNLANGVSMRLMRDSTELNRHPYVGFTGTAIEMYAQQGFLWLDSPSTVSAITYKTEVANNTAAAFVRVMGAASPVIRGQMTLMEISA